jgi:hypothetical protein
MTKVCDKKCRNLFIDEHWESRPCLGLLQRDLIAHAQNYLQSLKQTVSFVAT